MTIDEAIAQEKEVAKEKYTEAILCHANPNDEKLDGCIECAREHEQLAEWLEELKRLRENANGYSKEDIELNRKAMYNKAIDDFYNALVDDLTWLMRFGDEVYINVGNDVRIRAEQLKAGEHNG